MLHGRDGVHGHRVLRVQMADLCASAGPYVHALANVSQMAPNARAREINTLTVIQFLHERIVVRRL